jgi:large subunit ribosomal protein L30
VAGRLRITWKKSAIGYKENQKRTIEALGLRRLGQTVEQEDNRAVRGMITTVRHLVEVAEIDGAAASRPSEAQGAPAE